MKQIQTDLATLRNYHIIKDPYVFKKGHTIYKYSPLSYTTMQKYNDLKNTPVAQKLALANGYLYLNQEYIGYTMPYYRHLLNINTALKFHLIKRLNAYFQELLDLIATINRHQINYWDFHHGNVKVTFTGHPFLLDLDGSDLDTSSEVCHNQCEYLAQFILNEYTGSMKTTNQYINLLENSHTLSQKAIDYLYSTINLASDNPDLPYILLNELSSAELSIAIRKIISDNESALPFGQNNTLKLKSR